MVVGWPLGVFSPTLPCGQDINSSSDLLTELRAQMMYSCSAVSSEPLTLAVLALYNPATSWVAGPSHEPLVSWAPTLKHCAAQCLLSTPTTEPSNTTYLFLMVSAFKIPLVAS